MEVLPRGSWRLAGLWVTNDGAERRTSKGLCVIELWPRSINGGGPMANMGRRAVAAIGISAFLLMVPGLAGAHGATPSGGRSVPHSMGSAPAQEVLTTVERNVYQWYLCYQSVRNLPTLRASTSRTYSDAAKTVQWSLVYLNFPPPVPIKVDGWYGPATASAVTAFQRSRGLYVDGVVGPQTWRQLKREICSDPQAADLFG